MRSHDRLHAHALATLATLGFLAFSGGPGRAGQSAGASAAPADPALVKADNAFGKELFRRLRQGDPGRNLLVSPVSAAKALQMTFNGAAGATRDAMALALGIGREDPAALSRANGVLLSALAPGEPEVTLVVANSVWQNGAAALPAFTEAAQDAYGAEVGDLAGGVQAVNLWMSRKTHGLINDIVDPQAVLGPMPSSWPTASTSGAPGRSRSIPASPPPRPSPGRTGARRPAP